MSLLWAGGEDIDFPNGSTIAVSTGAANFRSGYARCALMFQASAGQIYKSVVFPGGGVTDCWLSFRWRIDAVNAGRMKIGLGKSGTNKGIFLGPATGAATKISVSTYDGSTRTELGASDAGVIQNYTLQRVDMQLTDYGADAVIKVWVNGALVLTVDADCSISGVSDLDSVFLFSHLSGSGDECFSEIIVADEDTTTFSLVTLAPSSTDGSNQWDGGYGDIDETSLSDSDLVYTDTADEDGLFGLTDTPSGSFSVKGIVISARACKSADASIGTLELGVKSGGTSDVDAGRALTTTWETYNRIAATINGSALTTAAADSMLLDLQSET